MKVNRGELCALTLLIVCGIACGERAGVATHENAGVASSTASSSTPRQVETPAPVAHVRAPDTLRGLYVNRWAAIGSKLNHLIDIAKKTEVNALVIDVKDDRGFVLYRSRVPLAREIGADTADGHWMSAARLRAVLDTMTAHDIYPIARIVVAKDPLLAQKQLELAIKRKSDLKPWLDRNGHPWLDPHQQAVWQYAADLAREAYDLGFSEVQFDYVRFPDEKRLVSETVYPLSNGRQRAQVIREQLGFLRRSLKPSGMRVTADVFGLTATDTTDMGIGQRWEMFVDQVDVVLPMVYPSHFARGTYKLRNPNAHPYETIDNVLKDAIRRTKPIANAARIIPWYQDFTLGPPHYYAEQVRAQKKAGYDNGFQSWILWNPKSNYTIAALEPRS
ncbi:MAG TPA: putative glycoside hydrolase [Gemmatimonadaceae bacterium]|nr:putative glycoside hydrolase [Gemmatimonadaceae bacterium]